MSEGIAESWRQRAEYVCTQSETNSRLSESKVEVLVTQQCPTLWDPMDCSPPGSSVHEFPRQEYWSGLPFPSPGDLPHPGIKPSAPALQADFFTI